MLNNSEWKAIFAPCGALLKEGEIIRRTNLSQTLATIADHGADAFYKVSVMDLYKYFLLTLSGSYRGVDNAEGKFDGWDTFLVRFRGLSCQDRARTGGYV